MVNEKPQVLYLDDEAANLSIFKACFRNDYEVFTATDPQVAYNMLKGNEIKVVIADQRMPLITGVEFLSDVRLRHPNIIRILLTAYTDITAVVDAINKGNVYSYVSKPWIENEIKLCLDNAVNLFDTRKDLEERNNQLKKTNEELSRFVYSASHDLRSPLRSMLGLVDLARMKNQEYETVHYLNLIEGSVKRLDGFINSIINYYKKDRLDVNTKAIVFSEIVNEALEAQNFYRETSDINLLINIHQEDEFINDEFRMKIILNNLVSNAIKYQKRESAEKSLKIDITSNKSSAVIVIEDNGIGIEKKYQSEIYRMFYRATHYESGSGIGLYLVKDAVDRANGTIELQSEEGKGTSFTVAIPCMVLE